MTAPTTAVGLSDWATSWPMPAPTSRRCQRVYFVWDCFGSLVQQLTPTEKIKPGLAAAHASTFRQTTPIIHSSLPPASSFSPRPSGTAAGGTTGAGAARCPAALGAASRRCPNWSLSSGRNCWLWREGAARSLKAFSRSPC